MGEIAGFSQIAARPAVATYKREELRLIFRMLVISAVVIFGIETLLMLVLEFVLTLPQTTILVLDGLFLVAFLFPLNYAFIVHPMLGQIHEHHRTEQDLIKSHEILERFFSIEDLLIAYLDTRFTILRVNQAFANAGQRDLPDLVGKNYFDLFPFQGLRATFETVIATGKGCSSFETPFAYDPQTENDARYWDWSLLPIKNANGKVNSLLLVLNDVTLRKQAQLAQADSEQRFRAVFNQTFQHIGILNPLGQVMLVNQTALDFTGLASSAVERKPFWQLPWWDTPHGASSLHSAVEAAARGEVVQCEQKVKAANGDLASMEITIKPLFAGDGKPVMLIYEARDITRHIRAEEALRRSEAEIKRLYRAEINARRGAETLREAGLDLTSSLNSGNVLEALLDHLTEVVPCDCAHIILFDDESQLLFRSARGEEHWPPADRLLGKRFDLVDLPLLRPMFTNRQPITIDDAHAGSAAPVFPLPREIHSWAGIPLLARDVVIGVCALGHTSRGYFTQDQIRWASALTNQAAIAFQNAWLFEQVRDARARLQELSRRLVEVQELERHHIARELHDEAGQALASLMVGLRLLERDSADPQAVIDRCQELKQVTDEVLENLHRLAVDLRPASLDHLGLVAALRQHTERVSDQHGLAIQFETVGEIARLPGEVETAVYRIVQEALTNVVRHAQASRVDVLLEQRSSSLFVIVEDNGIGVDQHIRESGQLGLLGIRERAEMLGGEITIESSPGKGTAIFLEVPCQSE